VGPEGRCRAPPDPGEWVPASDGAGAGRVPDRDAKVHSLAFAGQRVAPAEVLVDPLLKRKVGSKATDFVVLEQWDEGSPPTTPRGGIPLHSHRSEDEAWYVLEGRLRFRYGDREFDAPAGSGVLLPHGTPHTFWNPGPAPARYLLIVRPKTAALLEAVHAPADPRGRSVRELYAAFDVDLLE
jgi:mannose-6-phosphate isomerase-like protein (cupin superfamily)